MRTKPFYQLVLVCFALLLGGVNQAWAQTAVTATWFNNSVSTDATLTSDDIDISNKFSIKGASVNTSTHNFGIGALRTGVKVNGQTETITATNITIPANTDVKANPAELISFTLTPEPGLTFTPTNVNMLVGIQSTGDKSNNEKNPFIAYEILQGNTVVVPQTTVFVGRNDGGLGLTDVSFNLTSINCDATNSFVIKLYLQNYAQTSTKSILLANVTATGTISGTMEDVEKFSVTTSVNPEKAGSITLSPSSASYNKGTNITLTATAATGYVFESWTDGETKLGTEPTFTITGIAKNENITANFRKLPVITFTSDETGVEGKDVIYNTFDNGKEIVIPVNHKIYLNGKTLKGWNDGTKTYVAGDVYTINGDATLKAVFEDNAFDLTSVKTDVEVTWSFDNTNGGGAISVQGANNAKDILVTQATYNGQTIDVKMDVDATNGKCNNAGNATAQTRGTIFTIPASKNCQIEFSGTRDVNVTTIDKVSVTPTGNTWSYTYTGTNSPIDIETGATDDYYSYIKVTYPGTKCATPSYTTGNFNFERHATPVTFTAKEGQTLMVSVDDAEATMMDSPATVYPTTQATAYATADGLENSDIATAVISNGYDAAKPYVAWVYTSTYPAVKDGFANDKILNGLKENYNVVLIDYPETATPSDDLNNADLIVCTESMAGGKTMSNDMKKFVGVTPMINLKMYNYTSGRWSWGTPSAPGKTVVGFTPASKYYKVLDGVTFEADGNVNFYTLTDETNNHIQTVNFTSAPEDNVIMGKAAANGHTAMHCMNKFFGLGLSSDTWKEYNDNAVIVIKNAAAMLLAGEALDTEVYPDYTLTTADADFYTLYLDYDATIPEGIEVYSSVISEDKTVMKVNKVEGTVLPANTAVLLKSPAGAGEFTFEHATEAAATVETALLGVTVETPYTELTPEGKTLLTLGTKDGVVAFRKPYAADGSLAANRAYLLLDNTTSEAKSIRVVIGGDDTTGIREVNAAKAETETPIYNMAGQRVAAGTKGLLIKNGKKYINK